MIFNRILKVYKNSNSYKLAQQPIHIRSFSKISKWSNIANNNKLHNDDYNNDYPRKSISRFNNKFYNFTTSTSPNDKNSNNDNNNNNSTEFLEKLINFYKAAINENPKIESYYYSLYLAMRKSNKDFITMLNGETLDLVQVLIKEIGNSQDTNKLPYIELTRFLKDFTQDVIPIPYIHNRNKDNGKEEEPPIKEIVNFNKLYLFVKAWEIDNDDVLAIDQIAAYMVDYKKNILLSMSGVWITDILMCSLNYQKNKHKFNRESYLWLDLSKVLGENGVEEFDGKEYNSLAILIEGVEIFPMESRFYFKASKKLTNSYDTLDNINSDIGHPFYGKNRIELITQAIKLELELENKTNRHPFYISSDFYYLGLYLDKFETVNINGIEWNKIQCFTKSIEMDGKMVLCMKQLIKELGKDESVILNGQSITRQQLLLKMLDISNNILSTKDFDQFIYKQLKQYSSEKYGKLLQLENQHKINRILSMKDNNVPEVKWTKYNLLIDYINDKDGYLDKPITSVLIDNEFMSTKDMLIELLSFSNLERFYNFNVNYNVLYNLSQELKLSKDNQQESHLSEDEQTEKEANLQITTLGGQTLTKVDLIYNELKFSPNFSLGYYSMGLLTPMLKFQQKLDYFITSIKKDTNFGPAYFEIGKLLSSKHSNQNSVTILGKEYTIDQLFSKSLSLQQQQQ